MTARLGQWHSGAKVLFGLQGEMIFHLLLQASISAAPAREICQTLKKPPHESHDKSSAFTSKKRAMMDAVCSQPRVSARNCLRPAAVRR
jgi:hypothetical protein